ncbi:MAG: serine hydrolase domain-containing protein [Heteroscytonema crispum UTEX LB 1556]
MNLKNLLNLNIFFAISLTFNPSIQGYIGGDTFSQKAIEQSFGAKDQLAFTQKASYDLQDVLDEAVAEQKIPGAVMYISSPRGNWLGASGVSNLATKRLMEPTDGFAIASMSKTFVAVVVLKLAEEGKLNLDQAIGQLLPQDITPHIPNSKKITVRQLLNHTSGVAEYLTTEAFKKASAPRDRSKPWTAKEAIKYIYGVNPQALPGNKYIYTDSNYILLELIVEKITKGTLEQQIRDRILKPLALKSTFTELREPILGHPATGYSDRNKDGKLDSLAQVNDGNGLGDGGLVSNAEDLAKFAKALFAKKSLLSPKMMSQMLKFSSEGDRYGYGLGVERFPTPYGISFGHSGTAYGFVTLMAYLASKDTTVVVLLNNQNSNIKAIAMKALKIVNSN